MFKEGKIKYDNIQNKEKINVHPQLTMTNLQIEKLFLNIPNETENFSMNLSGVKTIIELSEINENEIEKLIIEKRKNLIEKFIAYAVKKIENKESSKSFIEGLIENLINRAINGLKIELNNIELKVKYKNNIYAINIDQISYSEENGVKIQNFEVFLENEENLEFKNYIINKFNIDIEIKKSENETENNQLILKLSDFQFELSKKIFYAFNEIINLIEDTKYKYIYVRNKKLIQYYKPNKPEFSKENETEEKNKYYNSLWLYSIKTVIKLQKYVGYDKLYLLDLPNFIQNKMAKEYVDNNSKIEKLLIPTEINLLKSTKEKVEKKVLDGKKGNALTNAFSFFFGGKKEEEEQKLTEDEKNILENIYTDEYLINYLYGKDEEKKNESNPLKDKIKVFISKLIININFSKLELILANDNINKCTLYLSGIKLQVDKKNDDINSILSIGNIASNLNENLFSSRRQINDNNDLIMVSKDKNNKIKIDLGFENIDFNEELFNFLLIFFSSLKFDKKNRIFREINHQIKNNNQKNEKAKDNEEKNEEIINNEEEKKETEENREENIKEEKIENKTITLENEILKGISISNIPSISISNNENKTFFSIINYSITPSKIEITLNIKDSFGTILDEYTFILNKDEKINKFILNLVESLKIILPSESSKLLFISFLKIKERIKQIEKRNKNISKFNNNKKEGNEIQEEKELFGFNYVIHKKLDLKNYNINDLQIEIIIREIIIEIYENKVKSIFIINDFNLIYANLDLALEIGKISLSTNLMSTMIIYLVDFESPNFNEFRKYIDSIKNEYQDNNINKNEIIKKADENKNEINIKYDINIDNILRSIKVFINSLIISFQADENIILFSFNKVGVEKKEENIMVKLGAAYLAFRKEEQNFENLKIFNLEEEIGVSFDPKKNLAKVKLTDPKVNADSESLKEIQKSFQYLMEQVDWEIILCKVDLQVLNALIKLNNEFNFSFSEILLKNFDEKNNDTIYLTVNNIEIKNKNNDFITGQKSLNINLISKTVMDYSLILNFSDLVINLSKNDIYNLYKIFAEDKENLLNEKLINKKEIHYQPDATQQKESHEYNISLELNIPLIDLCLCSPHRDIKSELFFSPLKGNTKIYIPAKYDSPNDISRNINFSLEKFKVIFNDDNNGEYNIIEYKDKKDYEYYFFEKSRISFDRNINKKNQIEISLNNAKNKNINDIEMNMNNLGINLKIDIIINLLMFIKDIIPQNILRKEKKMNKNNKIVENKKRQYEINFNINFNDIQIKLESLNNTGEISLYINQINYKFISIEERELPLGYNEIQMDKLYLIAINNDEINKILNTSKNFLCIKGDMKNDKFDLKINNDILTVNLSFTDINLIKNIISSTIVFYRKNKEILLNNENIVEEKSEKKVSKLCSLNYDMKGFNFILIDNYSNNYQQFLNLKLSNISSFYNEKKSLNSSVNISLSIYNYIASVWEPIIENSYIKSAFLQKLDNNSIANSIKIEIYQLFVNISDMLIGSFVLSLNNLKKVLGSKKTIIQNYEENISSSSYSYSVNSAISFSSIKNMQIKPEKKITNHKILNYTGKDLKIQFNNKIYNCSSLSETELEYKNISLYNQNNKKIRIYYDNNTIIDIPLGKLGIDFYKLKNDKFLVWEIIVSRDRQMNIILYSQIILKNKTNYTFQIKAINKQIGNLFILLKPNSKSGIPLIYYNKNTSLDLRIVEKEINSNSSNQNINFLNLSDIINLSKEEVYQKQIKVFNKFLLLKLQKKINNVLTVLITTEYSIINCLPCDIQLESKNKKEKIKKCSQFLIDFCSESELEIKLLIKTSNDYFYSELIKLNMLLIDFQKGKNSILFSNRKGQSFRLSLFLKNKDYHKSLIIYSDYILCNDSGINFKFSSNFLFNIADNIYLISNKINLEQSNFTISNNILNSPNINLQEIIKASPYYYLPLNNGNYNLSLSIKKNISFISIRNNPNFRENIISMIFYILPICKITNLISNKKLILRDYKDPQKYLEIDPLNQVNFNFFNKNKKNIILELGLINVNENKYNTTCLLDSFHSGIYTFFSNNDYFNLEISDISSDGILNIFISEATTQNAKIVLNNKTKKNFDIYQINYEEHKQIIRENEVKILKIFNQNYNAFIANICGKKIRLNFKPFKEEFNIYPIDNEYILVNESNGVRMKITLYTKNEFEKLNNKEKNLYANLLVNNCYISIIGDNFNKNKKLRNYKRNELLLIYLQNMNSNLIINRNKEIINKKNIEFNLDLAKLEIFNQFSKKGKYSCIFKNLDSPFLNLFANLDVYNNDKVVKINKLIYKLNKLKISIDPEFILEIINFIDNIAYRLGKIDYNVDKIFLRTNRNIRDIKIKKYKEKYQQNHKILFYGSELIFPPINIDYEITEVNLEKLLKEKIGLSDLIVWISFGLVRENRNIYLKKFKIDNYFGDFSGLILKMKNNYKSQMSSVILNLGMQGFIGQIKQFFVKDRTDENSTDVQKKRMRYPRAFYGKYNYIKNYSEEESKIIDKFVSIHQNNFKETYCNDILQSKTYIFYFSGLSLFIFTKRYELYYKIDFNTVDKIYNEQENLIIKYKKENDEENPPSIINCEEIHISKRLLKILNNYIDKSQSI